MLDLCFVNLPYHVERTLRIILEFVAQDAFTAVKPIFKADQSALHAGELVRREKRLCEKALQSARAAYHRYRAYCKSISKRPLFPGDQAFLHGLKDCPALLNHGPGVDLNVPGGSYIFDLNELSRMGVEPFKDR